VLQDVAPNKFVILVSPAQLRAENLKVVYKEPTIKCPAVILLGNTFFSNPLLLQHLLTGIDLTM
jgi:hypothetical protein